MRYEFPFPDIGEGIAEGTITNWLVQVGDSIEEGQSLVEVETDKVTTEIPSPRTGRVEELKFEEGDTIEVGQILITIDISNGQDMVEKEVEKTQLENKEEVVEEETAGVVGEVLASSQLIPPSTEGLEDRQKTSPVKKVLAVPMVRQLAKDLAIDINTVAGTGPNGRVMKEDVLKAKEAQAKPVVEKDEKMETIEDSPPVEGKEERIPLTRIRQTISQQMAKSRFTIPHTTAMEEIDVSNLVDFRNRHKDRLRDEDIHLTYLPFIIKAVVKVLKEFPEFNASYDEENEELILKHYYHMGIATDTDRGLMVPVLRDADKKSLIDIAEEIADLSTRAKENQVQIHELRGSTFSVTNYGSIGGLFGIPIINYPESVILGLGRIVKKPIVKDDEILIAHVLPLSLSYDHRIIDGASGARFLNLLKELLADPELLLMKS